MTSEELELLEQLVAPLANQIANMIARGVVKLADDTTQLPLLQLSLLAEETKNGVEHFQPYGFGSVPLAGAEAVTLFPNGDRGHPLAVVVADRRNRPTGHKAGEVFFWHPSGATITMTADGDIVAVPAGGRKFYVKTAAGDTKTVATTEDVDALADYVDNTLSLPVVGGGGGAATGATTDAPAAVGTSVLEAE